jgi:hypothetical protein
MLLENLLKHTLRTHLDYKNISKALKKVRVVAEQNHKTQLDIENHTKVFCIQKALNFVSVSLTQKGLTLTLPFSFSVSPFSHSDYWNPTDDGLGMESLWCTTKKHSK